MKHAIGKKFYVRINGFPYQTASKVMKLHEQLLTQQPDWIVKWTKNALFKQVLLYTRY